MGHIFHENFKNGLISHPHKVSLSILVTFFEEIGVISSEINIHVKMLLLWANLLQASEGELGLQSSEHALSISGFIFALRVRRATP